MNRTHDSRLLAKLQLNARMARIIPKSPSRAQGRGDHQKLPRKVPRGLSPAPLGYMPSIVIAAKITAITAKIAAAQTAAEGVTGH